MWISSCVRHSWLYPRNNQSLSSCVRHSWLNPRNNQSLRSCVRHSLRNPRNNQSLISCVRHSWLNPRNNQSLISCVRHSWLNPRNNQLLSGNIRIYEECEGRIEKSVPRIAIWHHEAICIINFTKPFLNFIDVTMIWFLNSKLDLNLSCAKYFRNLISMVTWCINWRRLLALIIFLHSSLK